jgi:hypothetical protein
MALAPVLGQRNPRSVPVVERVMLNLIGDDGRTADSIRTSDAEGVA